MLRAWFLCWLACAGLACSSTAVKKGAASDGGSSTSGAGAGALEGSADSSGSTLSGATTDAGPAGPSVGGATAATGGGATGTGSGGATGSSTSDADSDSSSSTDADSTSDDSTTGGNTASSDTTGSDTTGSSTTSGNTSATDTSAGGTGNNDTTATSDSTSSNTTSGNTNGGNTTAATTSSTGGAGCVPGVDCLSVGESCSADAECDSEFCRQGVCCDSACTASCMACSQAFTGEADGTCALVEAGLDPKDDCEVDTDVCGSTGECDGEGTCALAPNGIQCAAQVCSAGVVTMARSCDGQGRCLNSDLVDCSPYMCSSNQCASSCSSNLGCSVGTVCISGDCVAPSGLDGPCDDTGDCTRGECFDGVCGLTLVSLRIFGGGVSGSGSDPVGSWYETDAAGGSQVAISDPPATNLFIYSNIDWTATFYEPLVPGTYFVLFGGDEGSGTMVRQFELGLSDNTSMTTPVQVQSSGVFVTTGIADDQYVRFQWTGSQLLRVVQTLTTSW